MAWTTPRTWVKGDFPTVGRLNIDLRDNMNFLNTVLGCRVRSSVTQTTTTAVAKALVWDTEDFDADNMHSQSSNTGRLVVKTAGKFAVGGIVRWDQLGLATSQKRLHLYQTSGGTKTEIARGSVRGVGTTDNVSCKAETIYDCAVNDYFTAEAYQDSGANMNVLAGVITQFWAYRVTQ